MIRNADPGIDSLVPQGFDFTRIDIAGLRATLSRDPISNLFDGTWKISRVRGEQVIRLKFPTV